jgi:hypothetical protein
LDAVIGIECWITNSLPSPLHVDSFCLQLVLEADEIDEKGMWMRREEGGGKGGGTEEGGGKGGREVGLNAG